MVSISIPTAVLVAGGVGAAGAVAGSVISSGAAKDAAHTQADAAKSAAQMQLDQFHETRASLQPFIGGGTQAFGNLLDLTGNGDPTKAGSHINPLTAPLTAPFNPTIESLEKTPGYQFVKDQGLKAVQNGYAAQGLGGSGAAQKGAADYAEGLAGTTYQQQFGNYLSQNQQIYNMLGGLATTGQASAAGVGAQGIQATANAGANLTSGAAASAAGTVGSANALAAGLGALGSTAGNTALLSSLTSNGLYGTPSMASYQNGLWSTAPGGFPEP